MSNADRNDYWIVVPAYNEGKWISQVIDAIAAQTEVEQFRLVIVDNASTDDTAERAREAFARHPKLRAEVLYEPEKGTGCAADSGFRHAIEHGAKIVFRTDADCLPTPTWFAEMRRAMEERDLDGAGGKVRIRTDDVDLTLKQRLLSEFGAFVVPRIAPYVKGNREKGKKKYVLMPGPNVAMRAEAYERCGGYPRRSFDVAFLDKDIANQMRATTDKIEHVRRAVVFASERRTNALGFRGTIKWMRDRTSHQGATDIR
jgi:glycosyltransferase involved in cell wall biosynthesis